MQTSNPPNFPNWRERKRFNELTSTDSRYIFAKEEEFISEDAINVSPDAEDAIECCNLGNSRPKQLTPP